MTITNQAFIKVYRRDTAANVSPRLATAEESRTAHTLGASVEFVGATTTSRAQSTRQSAHGELIASTIDVLPPSPQAAAALPFLFKAGLGEGSRSANPQRPAPRRADAPSKNKRPLSTFLARHRTTNSVTAAQAGGAPRDEKPTRAGTTVASLAWPAVCRTISQQCAAELNAVVDVLLEQVARGRSSFGMLGLFPGCGCTTTALCLATRLTGGGRRTVLVDGNLYSPRVAAWLDVTPTAGWQEVLEDSASLADALVHATDDKLDVLVQSAKRPFDPLELAASPQASRTAEFLRRGYDLTLVDLGAFFDPRSQPVALELVRSMQIDALFAVAGPKPVDPRDLAALEEHLRDTHCELLGVIENRITS